MGRSKRSKDQECVLDRDGDYNGGSVQIKGTGGWRRQKRTSKRIYKRSPPTDYSWLHGTLFVVLLVIVIAWALGY